VNPTAVNQTAVNPTALNMHASTDFMTQAAPFRKLSSRVRPAGANF
jgi:hypothetical protein